MSIHLVNTLLMKELTLKSNDKKCMSLYTKLVKTTTSKDSFEIRDQLVARLKDVGITTYEWIKGSKIVIVSL